MKPARAGCADVGLMIPPAVAVLALLLFTLSLAHAECAGMGCEGPVREAYVICCNQLVYEPGKEGTGADRTVRCSDYLRNRATPKTRRSICNQFRAQGKLCPAASGACYSPNGRHCGDNMPGDGFVYSARAGGLHSQPSADSPTVGNSSADSRLHYTRTTRVSGQTWYYVDQPGEADGWIPGSRVSCTRPSPSDSLWPPGEPDIDWSVVKASEPDTAMAIRGGMEGGGPVYQVPILNIQDRHEGHPHQP